MTIELTFGVETISSSSSWESEDLQHTELRLNYRKPDISRKG